MPCIDVTDLRSFEHFPKCLAYTTCHCRMAAVSILEMGKLRFEDIQEHSQHTAGLRYELVG